MYPLPDPDPRRRRPLASSRRPLRTALVAALGAIVLGVPMLAQADPGLAPSAAPGGCSAAGNEVQCSIAVSFNAVPGASFYTAWLTLPGPKVIPFGVIADGGAGRLSSSLNFPYSADGTHTVTIQAWGSGSAGTPQETGERESADASVDGS